MILSDKTILSMLGEGTLGIAPLEPERYAAERKKLAELRDQGKIFLIEPETELDIGKLERDKEKLRAGYRQGRADGEKYWQQMRDFLRGGEDR